MTAGPGKYDDEATLVRERTGAAVTIVIVLGGARGSGFSVQYDAVSELSPAQLAMLLEDTAARLRSDDDQTRG